MWHGTEINNHGNLLDNFISSTRSLSRVRPDMPTFLSVSGDSVIDLVYSLQKWKQHWWVITLTMKWNCSREPLGGTYASTEHLRRKATQKEDLTDAKHLHSRLACLEKWTGDQSRSRVILDRNNKNKRTMGNDGTTSKRRTKWTHEKQTVLHAFQSLLEQRPHGR